jgi:ribose 5-phosphate isomerase B
MTQSTHTYPEYRKLYIGSDHTGYVAADFLIQKLSEAGYDVRNCIGKDRSPEDDYPDRAFAMYQSMLSLGFGEGILLCGSGEGMALVSNKFPGIRAVEVRDKQEAQLSRKHNGANVLCLGSRELSQEEMLEIVLIWLETPYSEEERHKRRREKVSSMESAGQNYAEKQSFLSDTLIPSLLVQDKRLAFERLQSLVGLARWVQVDIADETFTTSQTILPNDIDTRVWPFFFEAHLMVANPLKYIESCKRAGYQRITFHYEVKEDTEKIIQAILSLKMQVGIALAPKTPLRSLEPYFSHIHSLTLVSVPPGASGQEMFEDTLERIRFLRKMIPRSLSLWVDGGVNQKNISDIANVGADGVCVASALFGGEEKDVHKRFVALKNGFVV